MVVTNTEVSYQDEMRRVEFAEYPCDEKENEKRENEGRIVTGFACVQLRTQRFTYKDVNERPIEVKVKFNAGCELRCVDDCDSVFISK